MIKMISGWYLILNDDTRIKKWSRGKLQKHMILSAKFFLLESFYVITTILKMSKELSIHEQRMYKILFPPHVASIVFKEHKVLLKVFFRNYFKTISILCSAITKMYHVPLNRGENDSWCRIYLRSNYRIFTREKSANNTMKLWNYKTMNQILFSFNVKIDEYQFSINYPVRNVYLYFYD